MDACGVQASQSLEPEGHPGGGKLAWLGLRPDAVLTAHSKYPLLLVSGVQRSVPNAPLWGREPKSPTKEKLDFRCILGRG